MSYEIEGACIEAGHRRLLPGLQWMVPNGSVTVVFGPVSTGKSTLLAALSGRRGPDLRICGVWRHDGQALEDVWESGKPPSSIAWVPQIRHAPAGELRPDALPERLNRVHAALECGATTVLLDEPDRGLPESERERLIERLREFAANGGCVVVVTHNVQFGRALADRVLLVLHDRCEESPNAQEFFENPPSESARLLIERGCVSPPLPSPPDPPSHLRWLLPLLGGMGKPGLMRGFDEDLFAIASDGVTLLISITEKGLSPVQLRPYGIEGHHVPCKDMGVPTIRDALVACRAALTTMERGEKVVVHCRAGLGRTGTLLACILLHLGRTPEEAIAEVRAMSPRYIQSEAQLRFISRIGGELAA